MENVVLKPMNFVSYKNRSGLYAILKQKSKQLFLMELSETEGLLLKIAEKWAFAGAARAGKISKKVKF